MPPARGVRAGAVGVLDQVAISLTDLAVGLALARELAPAHFGVYAVVLAISLTAFSVQVCLVTDPLIILGSRRDGADQRGHFAAIARLQAGLSAGLALLVALTAAACALVVPSSGFAPAFGGLAVALVPVQMQLLVRAIFFAQMRPAAVLANDLAQCAVRLGGIALLFSIGALSPPAVFLLTGLASLVAALLAVPFLMAVIRSHPMPLSRALSEHWAYGRWMLASSGAHWVSGQAPVILVSGLLSPAAAAVIKACHYLVAPVHVALNGLDGILAPRASRLSGTGTADLHRFLRRVAIGAGAGAALYGCAVVPFADRVMDFAYKGRYSGYAFIVLLLAVDAALRGAARGPMLRLKIAGDTRSLFLAYSRSAIVGVAALVVLAPLLGLNGAAMALPLASLTLLIFLRTGSRAPVPSPATIPTVGS